MSLDGELKKWRDATEQLEPSPKLLASLQAQISPAPASAPPVGGSVAMKVITVVLITVSIGAAVWFLFSPKKPAREATADAGAASAGGRDGGVSAALAPCPPRGDLGAVAVLVPGRVATREQVAAEAWAQSKRRPMRCDAQLLPLEDLRAHGRLSPEERLIVDARRAVLCGLGPSDFGAFPHPASSNEAPPAPVASPCDESQWCRVPQCDLDDEQCLRTLDAQNSRACTVLAARQRLIDRTCVKALRRQIDGGVELERLRVSLAQGFGLDAGTPWCLEPAASAEAKRLLDLKVPFGSPPRRK